MFWDWSYHGYKIQTGLLSQTDVHVNEYFSEYTQPPPWLQLPPCMIMHHPQLQKMVVWDITLHIPDITVHCRCDAPRLTESVSRRRTSATEIFVRLPPTRSYLLRWARPHTSLLGMTRRYMYGIRCGYFDLGIGHEPTWNRSFRARVMILKGDVADRWFSSIPLPNGWVMHGNATSNFCYIWYSWVFLSCKCTGIEQLLILWLRWRRESLDDVHLFCARAVGRLGQSIRLYARGRINRNRPT